MFCQRDGQDCDISEDPKEGLLWLESRGEKSTEAQESREWFYLKCTGDIFPRFRQGSYII